MTLDQFKQLKPYDLVLVQQDGYGFCGQVISRPMGETVMIRRVPNDPSTMEEMHEGNIQRKLEKGDYRWVHYAVVNGKGTFPIDMLRYDFSVPVNFHFEEDRWGSNTVPVANEDDPSPGNLIIARCTALKKPNYGRSMFTEDRWRSFLWTVTPLGEPQRIVK